MCQVGMISNNILNLGTRTYRQRLMVASPKKTPRRGLLRLVEDLENFYESIHEQWDTINEADYRAFGPQLTIVISTLQELINAYHTNTTYDNKCELSRLEAIYENLNELNEDIRQFKLRLPHDKEMSILLSNASKTLNQLVI